MDNIIAGRVYLVFGQSRQLTVKLLISFKSCFKAWPLFNLNFDYQYHKSIYLGIVSTLILLLSINKCLRWL